MYWFVPMYHQLVKAPHVATPSSTWDLKRYLYFWIKMLWACTTRIITSSYLNMSANDKPKQDDLMITEVVELYFSGTIASRVDHVSFPSQRCRLVAQKRKLSHYIYIYIYTSAGWKVHNFIKILLRNMTKWGLFFNIVPLAVHTLLYRHCSA